VFWATTNDEQFLPQYDSAFRRRFQVINVSKRVDLDDLASIRNDIWAEAYALFQDGVAWWTNNEAKADLDKESYVIEDAWKEPIEKLVRSLKPIGDTTERFITSNEVYKMLVGQGDRLPTDRDIQKVSKILKGMGLANTRTHTARGFRVLFPKTNAPQA
jgi:predicted P-loop ATPase